MHSKHLFILLLLHFSDIVHDANQADDPEQYAEDQHPWSDHLVLRCIVELVLQVNLFIRFFIFLNEVCDSSLHLICAVGVTFVNGIVLVPNGDIARNQMRIISDLGCLVPDFGDEHASYISPA